MFQALVNPSTEHHVGRRWCVTRGADVLVRPSEPSPQLLTDDIVDALGVALDAAHFLGVLDGEPVWTVGVDAGCPPPAEHDFVHLRGLTAVVTDETWSLAARAVQIVEWARTHRFCGACGCPTVPLVGERAMGCVECGLQLYPRLSPAVIMAVHRGTDVLLAHGRMFPRPMYSTLAGFVEPGETLEDTVRREVREEVGVEVGEVTYFGSQPWPFPNSLMVGFFAEYAGGEIRIDPTEIVDARWFALDELPDYGNSFAISARLLDAHRERVVRSGRHRP